MSIYKMRTEFGHYLKWLLGLIAVIFIIGGVYTFSPAPPGSDTQKKGEGRVIAKVNDEPITMGQYQKLWDQFYDQAKERRAQPLEYASMRAMIFTRLIDNSRVIQMAEKMGVDVGDRRVNDEIDKAVVSYLRQNRQAMLGKLNAEREAVDPRDDSEYKNQLSSMGQSIGQVEESFRSRIPTDDVKAQLAQYGIQEKLRAQVKPVTEREIADSYNTYAIREIVLRLGSLPKAQVSNKAEKIASEAAGGADFATLARQNSDDPSKSQGGQVKYSFETSMMYPEAVRAAIPKLKPGEISRAIETPVAYYIIKLESVTPGMPAKLDPKAREQRYNQLMQMRMAEAMLAFQQQSGGKQKVEVFDSEMRGYWQMAQASQMPNPAEANKMINMAIGSLRSAIRDHGNPYASINLVQLLYRSGQVDEAVRVLYPMLEGENQSVDSADLRILLADMMLKTGKKEDRDAAVKQYMEASEIARQDLQTRELLKARFQKIGRSDLAANEDKLMTEYKKQMEQYKALREKQGNRPTPGGPGAPRPAGP